MLFVLCIYLIVIKLQNKKFAYRWENEIRFGNIGHLSLNPSPKPALMTRSNGERGKQPKPSFFIVSKTNY